MTDRIKLDERIIKVLTNVQNTKSEYSTVHVVFKDGIPSIESVYYTGSVFGSGQHNHFNSIDEYVDFTSRVEDIGEDKAILEKVKADLARACGQLEDDKRKVKDLQIALGNISSALKE